MNNNKLSVLAVIFLAFFITVVPLSRAESGSAAAPKGVWVTVFTVNKVLYSKAAALKLIGACKEAGITEIYLQLYQSGNAYYDSALSGRAKFDEILKSAKADTVDFIIKEARKNNIKVFAWVNLFSLGQNANAHILTKFGGDVLTRDQYLRPSGRDNANETDKYYQREEQLFLEPGDPRVAGYLIGVVDEIADKYPLLSGIHLDYARYPMTLPFIPGSRFSKYGISYGYGAANIESFKKATGLDPLLLKTDEECMRWDNWRREQITGLVGKIAWRIKSKHPDKKISCAVIAAFDRAYNSLSQDWPLWLEKGILDYVVLMNYTLDNQLAKETARAALAQRQKGKVYLGVGLFLMKDKQVFFEQYKILNTLKPDGVVFFSYDDLNQDVLLHLKYIGSLGR